MHLAAGFPTTNRDDWRALALEVLRKSGVEAGSPEEALSSVTYDGVTLAPLYDAADLPEHLPRARQTAGAGWDVRQRHSVADAEAVLADLEHGVTSLWLVLGDGAIPVGRLPDLLREVYLDLAPIVLQAGAEAREAAEVLFGLAAERGVSPMGNLGASIGTAGRDATVELAERCAEGFPGMRAVMLDATPYHDAGGSDADELGCSIALGVEHLRALTGAGLGVERAFGQLEFRYAVTADQFATIAKLRAARTLWARVAEVCGAADGGQRQHAVTSSAMMTARDPWVNLLRTTIACFAAGVGGADAVTVQPFDACLGPPDAFARRMARNTQALLLEEAGAGRVADPAGGSWYVERRTADLANRAWAWFQEIEAAGGIGAASELVAGRIADTRRRRADDIAHRRFPITGVSEFPDIAEKPVRGQPVPRAGEGGRPPVADIGEGERPSRERVSEGEAGLAGEGLPEIRYAQEFEALRDLADAQPERPVVFLATIGPVAAHTARAAFAANLFQAGGLATESAGPGTDPDQIATAFAVSGSNVACLCSSDKMYGLHAEPVAAALRRAGARKVWLAGKGDYEGVDDRLYAGCDALAVLRTTFDDLEVTR
ncbi:methylmalonyl-CoA mutase subunit beta [Nonomuraea sp. NEAU-A123]|uniref:methylmalonyl-CoA mutase subunit beta n=1 Tax=Nonomuraea sp. NEAU-A123 TaxID=2839649 RepID=UPI001BE41BF6|nr:methylmalonyl-CoA mutase subunit beta [Nonomuraea sp. NEAU-A123]MBT2232955.1 methylmalonyl-CoA mutase subunit beta [Nonomuraea sp. NEAU-A123]